MSILNSNTSCTLYKHVIIFVCSLAVCCRALEETELMAGSLVLSEQMLTASTEADEEVARLLAAAAKRQQDHDEKIRQLKAEAADNTAARAKASGA